MNSMERQSAWNPRMRKLTMVLVGVTGAAVVVATKDHPESLAITTGAIFTFLLVLRLLDPAGGNG